MYGIWSSQFFTETRIRVIKNGETNFQRERKFMGKIIDLDNVDFLSSNAHSSRKGAFWKIFGDNEAVIKMIIKGQKPFNEPRVQNTELLLIGCLIESIQTPRSKSNTLTPRTNSQTYWHREISHVMNGIIFCVCSTSAISNPSIILKRCRKEHKKMQVKKESQQNQSRWWIWSHDTAWGTRTCLPRLHWKAWRKPHLKVRTYQWARWMSSKQEQGDLWWAPAHQTTESGTLTTSALLKSGNLVKCWEQERGVP